MERVKVTLRVRDRDNNIRMSQTVDAAPSTIAHKSGELGRTIQKLFHRVLTPDEGKK